MKPHALLSVTDKTGIVDFARGLVALGFVLVSTGGTAKTLRDASLPVTDVAEITGFPEMMDGRIKTLHPKVHGGLLADLSLESHRDQAAAAGIIPFAIVAVNLYAFEKTVSGTHTREEAIESIDIGGPAMIRAAAKNHAHVHVVVDPADYPRVLEDVATGAIRRELMAKAFRHTAYYDSMIARYFSAEFEVDDPGETYTLGLRRSLPLRYGENPHQRGALYVDPLAKPGIAQGRQIWGKELSYNNILDSEGAWELVGDLPPGAVTIIKHGNPCGAAVAPSPADAYRQARESDPISAFGGIAAVHGTITAEIAEAMTEKGNFLEVVIGTNFEPAAAEIFKNRAGWGQNVRLIEAPLPGETAYWTMRSVRGGVLVQASDEGQWDDWRVVSATVPTAAQTRALQMQWTIAKHVKSNAIVVGTESRLLGVGAGQMNRVQSVRLALAQAGEASAGAALASDAFFPFPDSIETAADAGIVAIVQPGGSKKDDDVIAAANARGVILVMTGMRHFRH